MKLFQQTSERCDKNGKPYIDFFLSWSQGNKTYLVRVFPSFARDYKLFAANAEKIPQGESIEKYL